MTLNNDQDMKIFGSVPNGVEPDELVSLASELDQQRKNGNLLKARRLGEALAALVPESFVEQGPAFEDFADLQPFSAEDCYQLRVLLVFTAQLTLHRCLPSLLSLEAVNALYSKLEFENHSFYDAISEGTAFSFYYLSVRRNQAVESEIGENFAMLCGTEQDKRYRALGAKVFSLTALHVETLLRQVDFVF